MTDPASPAAVTEERIAEIRRKLPASFDQELAHETDKVLNYVQELRAAYDARGLELARVREERDVAIAHELEQRQAALDAEARLAQANEAKEAAENELLAAGMANIGMRRALMACADLMTDINPDDDNEAFWKDWDAAIKDARAKSTPTPPAQSAGEALDPAGTGEGKEIDPRDRGCLCQRCDSRYRVDVLLPDDLWAAISGGDTLLCGRCIISALEARSFAAFSLTDIRAQASALAEARNALAMWRAIYVDQELPAKPATEQAAIRLAAYMETVRALTDPARDV